MIYTQPQGTVYKYAHGVSNSVSIAVKADNNSMQLYGYHDDYMFGERPTLLSEGWKIVQNVHQLTQEEHEKLSKALSNYERHLGKWLPPKGFGANFVGGCLIVWPKGQEGSNEDAVRIAGRMGFESNDTMLNSIVGKHFLVSIEKQYRTDSIFERWFKGEMPMEVLKSQVGEIRGTKTGRFSGTGTEGNTGKSDGSSADYYKLPQGCSQLQDLISHCDMNAQMGEIFRAAYRYGRASHSDKLRDAKKIKFYIEAEIKRLES